LNQILVNGTTQKGVTDASGNNGLHYACRSGNLAAAKFAVDVLQMDMNGVNASGMTPLHYAVVSSASMGAGGRLGPCLQWLVMSGADKTATSNSGATPAELARNLGATTVAEWLGLCATTPKWGPSKETVANGGPGDAAFRGPFPSGSKTIYVPTRYGWAR